MTGENPFDIYTYTTEQDCFQFSQEDFDLLMAGCSVRTVKKGETVYSAGDANESVFFLREGKVKYHMIYSDGSSRTTAYSMKPGFIGVINFLPGHTSKNYCTAMTRCEISSCPIQLFLDRVREHGMMDKLFFLLIGASRHIYAVLTALLSEDRAQLVDMLRNQQMLTLQETADFVGCSREHVSRICRQLKEEKADRIGAAAQNNKRDA